MEQTHYGSFLNLDIAEVDLALRVVAL